MLISDYNVFKFVGKHAKQLYSVQPLPSCATVSANVPSSKNLHHNHN